MSNTNLEMENAKVQLELVRVTNLNEKTLFVRGIVLFGALISSFWLLYLMFSLGGFGSALLWFLILSLAFRFGLPLMFAVASSVLCFHFHRVGLWLPIITYIVGGFLLYLDLRIDRLRRKIQSF